MNDISDELFKIADKLDSAARATDDPEFKKPLSKLEEAANKVGKSWSGSWLGYHSRVYYRDLQSPPPGARFSQEWGFMDQTFIHETRGDWVEFDFEEVYQAIFKLAGNPKLETAEAIAKQAHRVFDDAREEIISLLTTILEDREDTFISKLKKGADELKVYDATDLIQYFRPKGQFMSRDMAAVEKGLHTPPHYAILANTMALGQPVHSCAELAKIARRAASHIVKRERYTRRNREIGTNVFIGHGRSNLWKDLKDFIQDRLGLPWDEFNRVPVAGITNIARLSQMLDDAAIAFLVMTGEDEQADGKVHARMNVVHEAGLFQGRLGFTKAIVLLEEGCEEFSNIHGLGQIRFPKDNIKAAFEEIRQVLEREGLLSS